ncbi:troponin C, slow skeletal and cardiac muscles-like [Symsagittifera roscoffensis]|uniref:troponin C, slow skeletal and cardiac muscles-like n=1 Tax=Symsagittifera roscoffensis TaxID=84072 RepID=UPI00307B6BEF
MATEELRDRIRKEHLIFRTQPELADNDIKGLAHIFKAVAEDGGHFADVKSLQRVLKPLDLKLEDEILRKYAQYNRAGLLQMTEQGFIDAIKYKLHSKKFLEPDCRYGFDLLDNEKEGHINKQSVERLCSARSREAVEDDMVEEMFQEGDKDEDGKIDWNDFLFHMRNTNILSKIN